MRDEESCTLSSARCMRTTAPSFAVIITSAKVAIVLSAVVGMSTVNTEKILIRFSEVFLSQQASSCLILSL